ncbi:hypothetical protein [Streptomyces sp. NRRL B-1347]|uniref:hypothetical protein n=1 Tax=Streptomyces sp. NRRL B-1347 TaxID=1476877 RepID=UPI0004C5FA9C|nr:hypothetical protein [Streptomyces sp. NRRL B-1347]
MHTPVFRSVEDAYLALLRLATTQYEHRIDARGNPAREVIGVAFRLPDPRQRLPYLATRGANPVFQYAEALWYLAGRRDLEMIGYYAPSMGASSADGVNLGGSAYGHTLLTPAPGEEVSPFEQVLLLFELYRQIRHEHTVAVSPDILGALDPALRWLAARRWEACAAAGGPR